MKDELQERIVQVVKVEKESDTARKKPPISAKSKQESGAGK